MGDIKAKVTTYIFDNFIMSRDAEELKGSDSLMERQILDSTGFIELITFLEEAFGIKVSDEEMIPENLDSLDNIEAYVQRKQS